MHVNELLKVLKVQGISTTTGMTRDEMARRPAIGGGVPGITRFGG